MELPSMVQRSGDTLIVRSVVSGNQLYMDHNASSAAQDNSASSPLNSSSLCSTSALEEQLERYRVAAQQQQQQYQQQLQLQQQQLQQQQQQLQQQQHTSQQLAAMELKDESLPQCKIKRNYSCSYCTYFTQNPRYHLTHLRDVHGEKIVINKCKLCLYASRHFQKLVRHMKMVHGCTEGIPGQHGQTRKRGMNREARKRKLEQSAVETVGSSTLGGTTGAVVDLSSVEQVKRGLQLQDQQLRRNVLAFNKQQQEEKQRQQQLQQSTAEAIFVAAYERQLQAQREHDIEVVQQQQNTRDTTATATAGTFQVPTSQHHQQHQQVSNKSLNVVPPSDSNSPPSTALTIVPVPYSVDQEPVQNRLLKCSVCDFTTLYRGQLVDHELEEHCKTKFFRCEKCSYVTHIKARFSKHVKYHSMPMIKCVTCDFRTPYKWNLDRHMKNHGGAGPFKCAACDFTADIKQSLTVHEMNHHVPPVGHAVGMSLARRRNKVGGTDLSDDFLSDSAELLDDQFNNNNVDDYEEILAEVEAYGKRKKYEDEEPTDLSQKGGSSDTSSVNNHSIMNGMLTPKSKRPVPNLIPIPKISTSVLNLSKDLAASRSSLTDIASMFFNDKQLSEMLEPMDKSDAAQLSPTTTMTSTSSQHSRTLLNKKLQPGGVAGGSLFDKLKLSALTPGGPCENLICPCGHMAKCLSESIIHRKSCNFTAITTDDDIEEEEQDDVDGRLEIDFDDDDKQSHSALNLSVTGSTRCQHCRHRCKSSGDLLNHLKDCTEAGRCTNDSYDSLSGESSSAGRLELCGEQQHHPMENRVFIWNKMPTGSVGTAEAKPNEDHPGGSSSSDNGGTGPNEHNDDNSYYGVETAPGYGEVTKKMTPEEEAANSCLKKVYKCPHCSFWASTASRFHVHIVGHLNKKPFECSLCSYRSNWRWDITKHIRLKTIRDPSHKNARVLMNDETGRRNYTKYNKYITLMKVTEEDGDPKLMKSGEMTPNQVASLAFLNDYKKNVSNGINALNGIKDDVTLEPITTATTPSKSSHTGVDDAGEGGGQMPDNFMNLPFIATAMMNAVGMAQQQQQQEQEQQHVTLITPSVTISAVKRSPPPPPSSLAARMKPSDDLVTDVKQEGNERKTYYKCRRCDFRHTNRDAVLAHVKIHYEDYPIVTATAMTSEPSSKAALQHSQQHASPLQVAVNSNLYMNKVFAAMCLSQQQQQNQNSASKNINNTPQTPTGAPQQQQQQQHKQHSTLSSGLLQQAIQGTSSSSPSSNNAPNSAISGLALALAGKSTLNGSGNATATAAGATSFLEHGEQNVSRNEASSSLSALSTGALLQPHATNSSCLQPFVPLPHQQSLQRLLTSPHGTNQRHSPHGGSTNNNINNNHHNHHNNHNNNNNNNNTFNNNNLVMGFKSTPASAATVCSSNSSSHSNTSPSSNSSQQSATISTATAIAATATVTTLPTANSTPTTSSFNHKNKNSQKGSVGASSSSLLYTSASGSNSNHNHNSTKCVGAGASGSGICIGGVVHGSYNNNSYNTTTTPTTSCNLLLNTATANANANATTSNTNLNSNNMLTNDNERRDPSPYRCGHCHQVSNWKHVIQRHCRLKHAGDILIEALDRSSNAKNDRHAAPLYRPIINMASNESNAYGVKALQQQQRTSNQNINNNPTNKNHNNNHNNNVLISKAAVDQLMHSPIARNTNNATPQDIQAAAAAAYLAAAYKAATANVPVSSANSVQNVTSAEDLLLQQQLQQNEQIEITRLPSNNNSNVAPSSLAQLLEHSAPPTSALHSQQNSKCKQQKCPLCPYISESKSQMNYHISLHKPTQYECALCSFVCAKKQHLSSHMRTVHQQQAVAAAAAATSAPSGNLSNLDFSVALQLAAANQAQQEPASLSQAPHAVDLSALKYLNAGNSNSFKQQQQTQQLSNEFHLFKIVSFCAKCPARFPRKINDAVNSTEFQDHLKSHQLSKTAAYKCDFCDFMAPHETLLQAHRFVHTAKYQEKCNELIRNCKEDPEHPAPKLMQITLNKHTGSQVQSAMIWVVDNELGEQFKQQQQNSSISSSSPSPYDNTNSLLKKQLESGPAPLPSMTRNSPSPKTADEYSSAAASTSASVATSDLAADAGSESGSMAASPASLEKCMHCPYETTNAHSYKAHLQHHVCVSHVKEAFSCEHCDYTDPEENQIAEHTRLHFNAMEKLKTVAFFTSYDQLELSTERAEVAVKKIKDQEVDDNNSSSSGGGSGGSIKQHNIKQEYNNNNEENVANENTLQEMRDKFVGAASAAEKEESNRNEMDAALPPPPPPGAVTTDPAAKKATKVILYKNDGCLSVKKDLMASQAKGGGPGGSSSERNNISDRLRRRISRSSHLNGGDDPQSQQQSHKTILVNAKTGQVISRN